MVHARSVVGLTDIDGAISKGPGHGFATNAAVAMGLI
jgi:hypothetical protein